MAKVYLGAGHKLSLNGAVARVGGSGTVADLQIEWSATAEYCGNDPSSVGNGIGSIKDADRYTYDVFLEEETGKFWFDDSCGY